MKEYKTIKREIEEEELVKSLCDNCKEEILCASACGMVAYILKDGCCNDCSNTNLDFCSLKCLKRFVNKMEEGSLSKLDT